VSTRLDLPTDDSAERSLLGAILIDGSLLSRVREFLAGEDFASEGHRLVYEACLALADRHAGVDLVTAQSELEKTGRLERVGGTAVLSALVDRVPDVENVVSYARIVREMSLRRQLILQCERTIRDAASAPNIATVIECAKRDLGALHVPKAEPPREEKRVVRMSLLDVIRNVKRRSPISLGLPHLDELLGGGLSPGESLVVGGGPGTIKTTTLATVIRSMAGPRTALYGIFFDEHYERVCRRIAARFGLRYDETEEPSASVMERLRGELVSRDALLEVIWPSTDPSLEEIIDDCIRATPPGRVPVFFLDHIHRVRSANTTDRDQPSAAVGKVVNAVLQATSRGGIVYAISEVTKASLNAEAVRANPQAVFADTRAILSRFDVGFATVQLPSPPDSREVLAEVIATRKNRFGDGSTGYVIALNLDTWEVTTRDVDAVVAESEGRRTAATGKRRDDQMRADEILVEQFIVRHAVSQEIGCKARHVENGLPAESGRTISRDRVRDALERLRLRRRVGEHDWKEPGKTGPAATHIRLLSVESQNSVELGATWREPGDSPAAGLRDNLADALSTKESAPPGLLDAPVVGSVDGDTRALPGRASSEVPAPGAAS
jgi:KaiC/GvpD/RAD55 family RecA-like ATPase